MWVPDLRRQDHPNLWHFIQENIENQHTFFRSMQIMQTMNNQFPTNPWTCSNTFEAPCSLSNFKQLQPVVTSWFGLVGIETSLYCRSPGVCWDSHPPTNPNHLGWSEHMSYRVMQLYHVIPQNCHTNCHLARENDDIKWYQLEWDALWISMDHVWDPMSSGALGSSHIRSTKQLPVCWALCRIRQEPKIEVPYSTGQ